MNQQCGSFIFDLIWPVNLVMLAILDATARADVGADIGNHTALGIFFRLQVVEFDIRFLFSCLACLLFILRRVVCFVSDTEQQSMPARNVLFWNQVIQANQFIFPALRPLIS